MKFNIKISILLIFALYSKITTAQKYEVYEQNGKKGIKQDEKVVLNADFDDILEEEIRKNFATVQKNGKWGVYFFGKEAKWLLPAKFDEISDQYYHYRIAFGPGYDYILDRDYTILDSVLRLELITKTQENKEYLLDKNGNETTKFKTIRKAIPIEEPYLLATKLIKDMELYAIYSLEENKIISPWLDEQITTLEKNESRIYDKVSDSLVNLNLLIYAGKKQKGFYLKNVNQGTDLEYELVKNFKTYLVVKKKGSNYSLYKINNSKLNLISDKYQFDASSNYLTFSMEGNKKGYIASNGIHFSNYDSLYSNRFSKDYFTSYQNGKYGLIDPDNDLEILPCSKTELKTSDVVSQSFIVHDDKLEKYYTDFRTKNWYKCDRDSVYPKKSGEYYYLFGKTNEEIGVPNKEIKHVDKAFIGLEAVKYRDYFKAKNLDNQMGIIKFNGDTLIPFVYQDIDLSNFDGDVFHYIILMKDNRKYLFNWLKNEIIEAPFDDIQALSSSHSESLFFKVITKGKWGVFNLKTRTLILDTRYDNIQCISSVKNYGIFMVGKISSKSEVFYYGKFEKNSLKFNTESKQYDFILNDFGYIKMGDKFEEYDLYTHEKIRIVNENEIYWEVKGISIFYEKGKFGVKNAANEIFFPAIYENLRFETHYQNDILLGEKSGKLFRINSETMEESFQE